VSALEKIVSIGAFGVGVWLVVREAKKALTEGETVVKTAQGYIGTPYTLGGNSKEDIDCSGLTQIAYKSIGVSLPRTARDQSKVGEEVARVDLRPGDLVYWSRPDQDHDHVGIYDGNGGVINASSVEMKVVTDPLSKWVSKGWYSGARRIIA
jgi:cell wall-associated NlpC family hydrolase